MWGSAFLALTRGQGKVFPGNMMTPLVIHPPKMLPILVVSALGIVVLWDRIGHSRDLTSET